MPRGIYKVPNVRKKRAKSFKPNAKNHTWDNKLKYDMSYYFRYTDWGELWNDWFLGIDSTNKGPKYSCLRSFALARSETLEQQEFLLWYLGPKMENDSDAKKYPFVPDGPVDWVKRRRNGGWFSTKNLMAAKSEIVRRLNALDALRDAGNKYTLNSLVRAEELAQSLDRAFNGEVFLPGLSFEENTQRANVYIALHEKIHALKHSAQDLYAKSHGINFEDMSGLVQLMTATAMASHRQETLEGRAPTKDQTALRTFVEMTMAKAAAYDLPIPKEIEGRIIEAVTEEEQEENSPPKKVQ